MIGSVLLALVPIGLLIALGAILRRVGFLGEGFWPQAERLSYYVLLPSLMVHGLTTARLDGVPVLAAALHPDRWMLWLGLLFILSIYWFPVGIVGKLRLRAWLAQRSPR